LLQRGEGKEARPEEGSGLRGFNVCASFAEEKERRSPEKIRRRSSIPVGQKEELQLSH